MNDFFQYCIQGGHLSMTALDTTHPRADGLRVQSYTAGAEYPALSNLPKEGPLVLWGRKKACCFACPKATSKAAQQSSTRISSCNHPKQVSEKSRPIHVFSPFPGRTLAAPEKSAPLHWAYGNNLPCVILLCRSASGPIGPQFPGTCMSTER